MWKLQMWKIENVKMWKNYKREEIANSSINTDDSIYSQTYTTHIYSKNCGFIVYVMVGTWI